VTSHLEAVGGEAEVVVEDGEEDNDNDARMMQMRQKHESMWPLTLRLWEVRLRLWLKTGRRTMTMMRPRMMQQMGQKHESMWPLILRL
jgi:hypothetical protein